MRHQTFRIPAGKKAIYGTIDYSARKSDRAIVFVHGLTGHQNEHSYFNAAQFFPARGFNTVRFNLYGEQPDARRLDECTVAIHAADLNLVVRRMRRKFKRIYLVGHSLGAPTILLADFASISAVVFWDPSYDPGRRIVKFTRYLKAIDSYVINWEVKHLWGTKMPRELLKFPDCAALAESMPCPLLVVAAGGYDLKDSAKKYVAAHPGPSKLVTIPGADHCFNSAKAEERLFKETLSWCRKF